MALDDTDVGKYSMHGAFGIRRSPSLILGADALPWP